MKLFRRMALIGAAIAIALLGALSLGAGVGRFHVVPVGAQSRDVHLPTSSAAILTPTSTASLQAGDVISGRFDGQTQDALYRVQGVDSWTHEVYGVNAQGKYSKFKIGEQVGTVSTTIPYVGTPYGWLAGTPQGLALLFLAMLLVIKATMQRQGRTPGTQRFGRWWWTRLGAAIVASIGVLSLTAGASFTGTATVTQGSITAGHMAFTLPAAGSSYRLQTGASDLAPGDMMQRTVDLQMSASNSTGIIGSVQLQMSTSPSTAGGGGGKLDDATQGMKIWVQKCSTAWVESGPPYTYTCTGGAGNTSDVLGSSLPYTPPANTCAPGSGTVSKVSTVEGAAQTLSNITTTASAHNYLLVFMCVPTAADDTYQDATATFTYTFTGVQRSGVDK